MAEDYFAAMERVEQRLGIVPKEGEDTEDVKVQIVQLIQRLEVAELGNQERLGIAAKLVERGVGRSVGLSLLKP